MISGGMNDDISQVSTLIKLLFYIKFDNYNLSKIRNNHTMFDNSFLKNRKLSLQEHYWTERKANVFFLFLKDDYSNLNN